MDPTACVSRVIMATGDQDYQETRQACEELVNWLAMGGALPQLQNSDWQALTNAIGDLAKECQHWENTDRRRAY